MKFSSSIAVLTILSGALGVSQAFVSRAPLLPHSPTKTSFQRARRASSSLSRLTSPHLSTTTERDATKTRLYLTTKSKPANGLGPSEYANMEPRVYPQRWVQLGYLSALALLSDWICFSVAAAPQTFENAFDHSAAGLIDMFLFMNVASCFIVTDVVSKIGLQKAVQGAAVLMAAGCWLRSGLGFAGPLLSTLGMAGASTAAVAAGSPGLVPYPFMVAGTLLVGFAQPFFQCTPPVLSAQWFAPDERATSTAVALNFNQIGIATAFLVGGAMATNAAGMEQYFGLIAVMSTLVAIGSALQFQNEPPIPPSSSELEKKISGHVEPPFLESVQKFFKTKGFSRALAAFVCSISITNIVGAFIDQVLERGGMTEQFHIDLAGAAFEIAILIGGIVIGGYVDKTKEYKKVTQWCLIATAFFVLPLGLTDHAIGHDPLLLILSLLGLGLAAGPVQPINAELAVDVTYPGDETAVESVQQVGGNLVSALLVPLAEIASKSDFEILQKVPLLESDIRGDVVLLVTISLLTLLFFSGFDAPLKRSMADDNSVNDHEESQLARNDDLGSVDVIETPLVITSLEQLDPR